MRKRTLLAIIITIITVVLFNKCWLEFKPIQVSFNIAGSGPCTIKTIFNKKDNDKFKKVKSKSLKINLDENHNVSMQIDKPKFPKRVRFRIKDIQTKEKISISKIKIGKFDIKNLDKFKIKGAAFEIKHNKLVLKPIKEEIVLTYPDKLKVRAGIKFDFKMFIIILVLTYLLAYKLIDYVADFKTVKNKSRIDITFLMAFFILLFIPMSNINQENISEKENRTLAKWQPLIKENNEINFEFGKNFNDWFNDRFAFREMLYGIYQFINYNVASEYYNITDDIWINKKNNWFINSKFSHTELYTKERLQEISNNVKLLQKFCKDNNIKPYIIIPPYKAEFCTTLAFPVLFNPTRYNSTIQAIDYLKKHNGIDIIYPYEEIRDLYNKAPSRAYFKSDHHWTDESAYLGYIKLMQQIKHDFPNIHITKENEYNFIYSKYVRVEPAINKFFIGMTARNSNISDEQILDTQYKYYVHKNSDNIKFSYLKAKDKNEIKYYYESNIKAPKMYMYGDSFDLNLLPIIVNSFSNSQVLYVSEVRKDILKLYEQDIIDNNTDVLIICVHNIDRLANLYKKEGN